MTKEYVTKDELLGVMKQMARSIAEQDPHFLRRMAQEWVENEDYSPSSYKDSEDDS